MTTFQPSVILDEVKNLVIRSCKDCQGTNSIYHSFHKGLLKMYFEARNVEIDYEGKTITAEIPVSGNEFTTVTFECQDLSRFLASCIKNDKRSLTFYQSVLSYYNLENVA